MPSPALVRTVAGVVAGLLALNTVVVRTLWQATTAASPAAPAAAAEARDGPACEPAPLELRAGQVLVVGLPHVLDAEDPLVDQVLAAGVGGVLVTKTNVRSVDQITALIAALRRRSPLPLLVATDEEPGRVSSFGRLLGRMPSARTLARSRSPEEVTELGTGLGRSLASLGVDVALAPVLDLDDGPPGGIIGDRSFAADPWDATAYGMAFSWGLAAGGVQPAVKHYPGHGRSRVDSHRRLAAVDVELDDLWATDVLPFAAHVGAGVRVVMLAHVAYEGLDADLPASLSPAAYRSLRDLGFHGVAMTDSLGMGAVHQTWDFPVSAVMAVGAGADAVLATDGRHAERMRDALVSAVTEGRLDEARLDEAAARMLALRGLDPAPVTCLSLPKFPPGVAAPRS